MHIQVGSPAYSHDLHACLRYCCLPCDMDPVGDGSADTLSLWPKDSLTCIPKADGHKATAGVTLSNNSQGAAVAFRIRTHGTATAALSAKPWTGVLQAGRQQNIKFTARPETKHSPVPMAAAGHISIRYQTMPAGKTHVSREDFHAAEPQSIHTHTRLLNMVSSHSRKPEDTIKHIFISSMYSNRRHGNGLASTLPQLQCTHMQAQPVDAQPSGAGAATVSEQPAQAALAKGPLKRIRLPTGGLANGAGDTAGKRQRVQTPGKSFRRCILYISHSGIRYVAIRMLTWPIVLQTRQEIMWPCCRSRGWHRGSATGSMHRLRSRP